MNKIDKLEPLNLRTTPAIISDKLREQILAGVFGAGEKIADQLIAQRLGVSRGPVREALPRLVQEGLLINLPNRGVCVVELDHREVADIFTARRAIEREAAAKLFDNKQPDHIAKLELIVEEMSKVADSSDNQSVVDHDLAFHTELVDAAGSMRLSRMFATLMAETRLCLANLVHHYPLPSLLVEEHRDLLVLLRGTDKTKLLTAIDEHLDSAVRSLTGPHG